MSYTDFGSDRTPPGLRGAIRRRATRALDARGSALRLDLRTRVRLGVGPKARE